MKARAKRGFPVDVCGRVLGCDQHLPNHHHPVKIRIIRIDSAHTINLAALVVRIRVITSDSIG